MTKVSTGYLTKIVLLPQQTALSLPDSITPVGWRKVRTPQSSIAANGRRHAKSVIGQVQQKASTGNAVVKSGKLYAVKCHVNLQLRAARPSRRVGR